jgi:hypothetical protein
MRIWFEEFLRYRRAVWVPTAAVAGALTLALLFVPFIAKEGDVDSTDTAPANGIHLMTTNAPYTSTIQYVDYGDSSGSSFAVDNERGGTVGVVWIVEKLRSHSMQQTGIGQA